MKKIINNHTIFRIAIGVSVFAVIVACFIGSTIAYAQSYVDTSITTTDALNVRAAPGLGNRVLSTLSTPGVQGVIVSEPERAGVYSWVKARFTVLGSVVEGFVATDFVLSTQGLTLPVSQSFGTAPVQSPSTIPNISVPVGIAVNSTIIAVPQTTVRSSPGATQPEVRQLPTAYTVGSVTAGPITVEGFVWYEVSFPVVRTTALDGAVSFEPVRGWVSAQSMYAPTVSGQSTPPTNPITTTPSAPQNPVPPSTVTPLLANGQTIQIALSPGDVRSFDPSVRAVGGEYNVEFYGEESPDLIEKIQDKFGVSINELEESNFFMDVTRRDSRGVLTHYCSASVIVRTINMRDRADNSLQDPFGIYDLTDKGAGSTQIDCTPIPGSPFVARINNEVFSDFSNWERRVGQRLDSHEGFGGEGG